MLRRRRLRPAPSSRPSDRSPSTFHRRATRHQLGGSKRQWHFMGLSPFLAASSPLPRVIWARLRLSAARVPRRLNRPKTGSGRLIPAPTASSRNVSFNAECSLPRRCRSKINGKGFHQGRRFMGSAHAAHKPQNHRSDTSHEPLSARSRLTQFRRRGANAAGLASPTWTLLAERSAYTRF